MCIGVVEFRLLLGRLDVPTPFCGNYYCHLLVLLFCAMYGKSWRLPRDRLYLIECNT